MLHIQVDVGQHDGAQVTQVKCLPKDPEHPEGWAPLLVSCSGNLVLSARACSQPPPASTASDLGLLMDYIASQAREAPDAGEIAPMQG